jgi:hypothetical protein
MFIVVCNLESIFIVSLPVQNHLIEMNVMKEDSRKENIFLLMKLYFNIKMNFLTKKIFYFDKRMIVLFYF